MEWLRNWMVQFSTDLTGVTHYWIFHVPICVLLCMRMYNFECTSEISVTWNIKGYFPRDELSELVFLLTISCILSSISRCWKSMLESDWLLLCDAFRFHVCEVTFESFGESVTSLVKSTSNAFRLGFHKVSQIFRKKFNECIFCLCFRAFEYC